MQNDQLTPMWKFCWGSHFLFVDVCFSGHAQKKLSDRSVHSANGTYSM